MKQQLRTNPYLKSVLHNGEILLWFRPKASAGRDFIMPRSAIVSILLYFAIFPIVNRLTTINDWSLYLGIGILLTLLRVVWAYFASPQLYKSFSAISNQRLLYSDANGLSAYAFSAITKCWMENESSVSIEVTSSAGEMLKIVLDDLSSTHAKTACELLLAAQRNRIEYYARENGLLE